MQVQFGQKTAITSQVCKYVRDNVQSGGHYLNKKNPDGMNSAANFRDFRYEKMFFYANRYLKFQVLRINPLLADFMLQ